MDLFDDTTTLPKQFKTLSHGLEYRIISDPQGILQLRPLHKLQNTSSDDVGLIVTVDKTEAGTRAADQLRTDSRRFGARYLESFRNKLADSRAGELFDQQLFAFHLLQVPAQYEGLATRAILGWHNGQSDAPTRGRVLSVERNWTLYPSATTLGLPFSLGGMHSQYLKQMNVTAAQSEPRRFDPVRVAVLDSGLQPSTIGVNLAGFYDVEGGSPGLAPAAQIDNNGHGTAMALLINSVSPTANFHVVRVLDTGPLNLWNLLAGAAVAIVDCEADVVSMSLGFDDLLSKCGICGATAGVRTGAFERVLQMRARGKARPIFVASTGNERSTTSINFPASSANCLAFGSVDSNSVRTTVSNYGSKGVYYALAPGGKEDPPLSNTITEDVGLGGSGAQCWATSVATAYGAGMLALMRGMVAYASFSNEALVDELLQSHCVLPPQMSVLEYGAGIIQFSSARAKAAGGEV
jgi:subtilisin